MITPQDYPFMARAIALAKQGWYSTSPNPRVGCVIVKQDRIIGEGWHERAGSPHAEVHALAQAGLNAKDATAYVSLEPCSHHGRTPPCAMALVKAGVARVVYAMQDPNPDVSGRGLNLLREAGIEVDGPLLELDAKALNPGFIRRMIENMPLVIAKQGASLDGRTAMASGESQWITGPEARADVQKLRAASCAIVTGIGTVLKDDPQLTVRDEALAVNGIVRQPLRVVIDSRLRIPLAAKILQEPGQCMVVHAFDHAEKQQQLAAIGVECVKIVGVNGQVDLKAMLSYLAQRQCNQVMIEAGQQLVGAMQKAQLIDEYWLYMAPTLLGHLAQPLMQLPLDNMSEQQRFTLKDVRRIGDDVRFQLSFNRGA